jgi:uncharacterized protein YbjT (DUF2867 family)
VLVRDCTKVEARPWADAVEICRGDLVEPSSLASAMQGMDAAYYLVHSMSSGHDYAESDRRAATNFVRAGKELSRVIYLGGLLPDGPTTSEHLRSRAEVGRILRDGLPTLEVRAGPIVGSGSASFEMVRYLTERLPILISPSWIRNEVQPIAIRDIISYLTHALDRDVTGVLEVGGDRVSFRQMLEDYAEARGLKRVILLARPVFPPRFAASAIGLVTGLPPSLTTALLEGIIHPVLADTTRAKNLFPRIVPLSHRVAVDLALKRMRKRMVETHWHGSFNHHRTYRMTDREGSSRDTRSVWIAASPKRVFQELNRLGGDRGWLTGNWGWRVWGPIDRLMGGPGLRSHGQNGVRLVPGEALGLWKVEASETPRLLRLRAEMRMPGEAWLQFETIPEDGGTRLVQRLLFEPVGLPGVAYWYAFYPMRRVLLGNLVRSLARGAAVGGGEHHPQLP